MAELMHDMDGSSRERRETRERELVRLAEDQHGVVSRRQLLGGGLNRGAIAHRLRIGRLFRLHESVYAVGRERLDRRGIWMGAVLAAGPGAVLSHRSAARLWGLTRGREAATDVISASGRAGRERIALHECQIHEDDTTMFDAIPVTTPTRTLFDLSEVVSEARLASAWEEADRLNLLELRSLEGIIERGWGRHALKPVGALTREARHADKRRSPLEDRFADLCKVHHIPPPASNVQVLGFEVDALWPRQRLAVELDSVEFHMHRAAFERDRARDAVLQSAGYCILRITDRRMKTEEAEIATQIRELLNLRGRAQPSM